MEPEIFPSPPATGIPAPDEPLARVLAALARTRETLSAGGPVAFIMVGLSVLSLSLILAKIWHLIPTALITDCFGVIAGCDRLDCVGVCQRCCPPISCSVSDFRGADFAFGVEPDGSGRLSVAGFA